MRAAATVIANGTALPPPDPTALVGLLAPAPAATQPLAGAATATKNLEKAIALANATL